MNVDSSELNIMFLGVAVFAFIWNDVFWPLFQMDKHEFMSSL